VVIRPLVPWRCNDKGGVQGAEGYNVTHMHAGRNKDQYTRMNKQLKSYILIMTR